ncbi:sulfate adenylyltransferase subunit CysN [Henriciella mobilis]|uniref:sulfate adenylyltransferase subunit CysN n=1 Tax=Henriciella mobilis TaxID=2305467 RepID=UPI000E66B794|nr:sulfate adenylyltransferase subunit CysN [Henriciella mobilis]RIJ17363.1 sulfate adenylyltransferase subunit CysN [Henriciella mobilis]RIJ25648.1 sulfate adenylyltransferase subunit CysN [Henriciella mobilis]
MNAYAAPQFADIETYLDSQLKKSLLRFITCGSVDDGKSTLIGRLLYESKMIFDDQLASLKNESKKFGTQGEEIDFALLVDGLAAEREQGITIDVAYRFFSTDRRKFIVADTPGHEQYTRNMATGASTADLAIVMIDARKGVLTQTRRHSFIVSLLGIKHVVLCINKMDLVDYDKATYDRILADYREFTADFGFESIQAIPVSALAGDNIVTNSDRTAWYDGPPLIEYLDTVEIHSDEAEKPFRMPVQWVNRPNLDFRGFAGQVISGTIKPGDKIRALPSGRSSAVSRIVTMDGDLEEAVEGQSVTLTLEDEIDISRGDVLCADQSPAEVSDQFQATMLWMSDSAMLPGRSYVMKMGARECQMQVTEEKYRIDVNTRAHEAAKTLGLNEIGVVNIALDREVAFDPYKNNRRMGGFIVIDRMTNETVGLGLLNFALRRASNIHRQSMDVSKEVRASMKGQKPVILWFTGLSGAGKSTVANIVEKRLAAIGKHTYTLDGDNVRHGLNNDLGFTDADRVENIRRVGEVSKLMIDAGLIVLVSFISPFRAERRIVRQMVDDGEFWEIFVDAPIEVAEQRDVKGLYKKARAGEIKNFTGIDSPYEPPMDPEIHLDTNKLSPEDAADLVMEQLQKAGTLSG